MPDNLSYYAPVPEGVITQGWEFHPDNDPEGNLKGFRLTSRFGTLCYGKSPAGNYDTWWFEEIGGGGACTLPYAVDPSTGKTFVGLLAQRRPLQDENEPVLGVPRGFIKAGETHDEAAVREYQEETGDVSSPVVVRLQGDGANPNNAFFDTRGGGVQFFAVQVPWAQLKENPSGEGLVYNKDEITEEQRLEGIERCVFVESDMRRIAALGDMMTLSCYLRWLAFRQA